MVESIEISFKSFESKLVHEATQQIIELLPPHLKFSQFSFPMVQKKFTVLRSPHIDKKSREQFQIQYYKKRISFQPNFQSLHDIFLHKENRLCIGIASSLDSKNIESFFQMNTFQLFLENIKSLKFVGVQMKIKIIYSTFLNK